VGTSLSRAATTAAFRLFATIKTRIAKKHPNPRRRQKKQIIFSEALRSPKTSISPDFTSQNRFFLASGWVST
jgi:hypothetical protein